VSKRKFARTAAVATTLVATVALISSVVAGSGAYFTDSHGGQISGNLGTVAITVTGQAIDFKDLLPGVDQSQTVTVTNTGTGPEDIYLAFDNSTGEWSAVNDLGMYGIFTINNVVYDNLNNTYPDFTPGSGVMSSSLSSGCYNIPRVAINYLPHVIKLGTLSPTQQWSFNIAFHFNACMTGGNGTGASLWGTPPYPQGGFNPQIPTGPLPYVVAAFQPGVNPNDQMNGAGKIADLVLPYSGDQRSPAGTFQH